MESTIFLNQITVIDHAFVGPDGLIYGGSWLPDFFVTGEVSADESVVVDFSTIKKDIKSLIDDEEIGFDHKLLFFEGISKGMCVVNGTEIKISSEHISYTGPFDSVKIVKERTPTEALQNFVQEGLRHKYGPSIKVRVKLNLDRVHGLEHGAQHFFRYVHGLKSSTSWGCGNIVHGHLSFLEAIGGEPLSTKMLLNQIASTLDKVMFIYKENIIDQSDSHITIGYDSTVCGRGPFRLTFNPNFMKFAILDTETTIEHLVEFVETHWGNTLRMHGIKALLVSEGLSKGAVLDLTSEPK